VDARLGRPRRGRTHQPIEQLSTLRLIPNFTVVRPADANETSAAWLEIVRRTSGGPVGIALTRQNIPVFPRGERASRRPTASRRARTCSSTPRAAPRRDPHRDRLRGAARRQARETLAAEGIQARVVSAPSLEWFAEQDAAYRESVLRRPSRPRVRRGGSTPLWRGIVGDTGRTVGIDHFGASADYKTLFEKFGITADAVVEAARATVKENA
jgi:transketolase